jgi:hypothetical protein
VTRYGLPRVPRTTTRYRAHSIHSPSPPDSAQKTTEERGPRAQHTRVVHFTQPPGQRCDLQNLPKEYLGRGASERQIAARAPPRPQRRPRSRIWGACAIVFQHGFRYAQGSMPDKTTQLSDLQIAHPRAILHIHPSMASTPPPVGRRARWRHSASTFLAIAPQPLRVVRTDGTSCQWHSWDACHMPIRRSARFLMRQSCDDFLL